MIRLKNIYRVKKKQKSSGISYEQRTVNLFGSKDYSTLEAIGALDENTVKIINHFSHNGNPLHHVLEERVKDLGYLVSCDGMSVTF